MPTYRTRFLQLALRVEALRFGQFTLKSGRISPYFFNAGQFHSGQSLAGLAACQADALQAAGLDFDLLFGPAYKGIPLATALASEYARRRGRDLALTFDRKEAKDHGEGGHLIGADMAGKRVLIVDDVITAGTAVRQSLALIQAAGGIPVGIIVALDRQEIITDDDRRSATQVLAENTGIAIISVATLHDLLAFADQNPHLIQHREPLLRYRQRYGADR